MRLLFVIEHLDPARGGAERFLLRLANMSTQCGHEVHFVTQSASDEARGCAADIHLAPGRGPFTWQRTLSFDRQAARIVGDIRPDVALGVGKTTYHNVFRPPGGTYRASRRQSRAAARTFSADILKRAQSLFSLKERVYLALERRQYSARNVEFIAQSHMIKGDMVRYYDVPEDRIHIVYNGVDTARFSPLNRTHFRRETRSRLGIGDDDLALLIVAHNFRQKGVDNFLRTIALLERRLPVRGIIVGKGRQRPFLSLAESLGLSSRIQFVGPVPDTAGFYAAADIYFHPAWYDPCPNVFFEAVASGLPVVTTGTNGAAALIEQGSQGFVIADPADHPALAEALETLADPPVREAAGRAARALALQHTLETNFQELMRVFEVAKRRSPLTICDRS